MQFLIHLTDVIYDKTGIDITTNKTRKREVVDLRRIYADIAKELTSFSLEKIGSPIGRGHCNMIHLIKTSIDLRNTDKNYRELYLLIFNNITLEPKISILEQSYQYHLKKCRDYKKQLKKLKNNSCQNE